MHVEDLLVEGVRHEWLLELPEEGLGDDGREVDVRDGLEGDNLAGVTALLDVLHARGHHGPAEQALRLQG